MEYPETIPVFFSHGLPCALCNMAFGETVAQGAAVHGIDLKTLLKDLNEEVNKKKAKK